MRNTNNTTPWSATVCVLWGITYRVGLAKRHATLVRAMHVLWVTMLVVVDWQSGLLGCRLRMATGGPCQRVSAR